MSIPFSSTPQLQLPNLAGESMHRLVAEIRAEGPAVAVELPEGIRAWLVTQGKAAAELMVSPDVSRDPNRAVPGYQPGSAAWLSPWVDLQNMTTKDGPEHARLRRVVVPALTYRRIQRLKPAVSDIIGGLVEELGDQPSDVVDVHALYSYRIPTLVICDVLGIPATLRPEVLRVFRLVARTDHTPEEASQLHADLLSVMRQLINHKKSHPQDDLTSTLISESSREKDPLTEDELIATLLLVIGGGSQTTINLIDHAIAETSKNPALVKQAQADPATWNLVIEETLRKHCPVMNLPMRWALKDIHLDDGTVLRAGDAILLNYSGHGRDPQVNECPHKFDVAREDRDHLAFGRGVHRCPGSHLAILEAEVALDTFFGAFPEAELVDSVDQYAGPTFIGNDVTSLPMRLRHAS